MVQISEEVVRDGLNTHKPWLLGLPGVDSVGYGKGRNHSLCLKVYGDGVTEETKSAIREKLGEIPVEFEPTIQAEFR